MSLFLEPVTARACPSARLPRCYRKNRFSENLSENEVSHRTTKRWDGECCPIRKIPRSECPRVSQWAVHWVHVCANTHTKTCMHMFFRCIELSVCFHMVFIDPPPSPRHTHTHSAPFPSVSDGEGMMECRRVNLWFPGSWSGFIRSGCDNTPADGLTERLSYKDRSANKKAFLEETISRAEQRPFLEDHCGSPLAGAYS